MGLASLLKPSKQEQELARARMRQSLIHVGGPNTRVLTLSNTNELLKQEGV
jgi:hypothetical protein